LESTSLDNKPNDIPVYILSRTSERNLLEMIGNKNLPEPVKVIDGVLM